MKRLILIKAFTGFRQNSWAWFETVIVSILAIIVWIESDSLAPTSTTHNFFWPILGPLLISLRYGFAKGFTCSLLILVGLATYMELNDQLNTFSLSLAIGIIIVAMIAGEFQDYWHNINRTYSLDRKYMSQKLESFTQNYHLLKISHDQLEQRTAGQTISLRASINSLRQLATQHPDHRIEFLGHPILNLLADIGGIEVAGIYSAKNGHVHKHAHAIVGDHHKLVLTDPMLQDMLKRKKVLSPAKLDAGQTHHSRYQLCVPLLDTHGSLQAIIVAEKAKFYMQTQPNIAILSLVANYAADLLCEQIVTPILQPHQNELFRKYIERAAYNKRHYGADTALVVFIAAQGDHHDAMTYPLEQRRDADIYWSCKTQKGQHALAILLPLTTLYEAQQFINRLNRTLSEQFGTDTKDIDVVGPLSLSRDQEEVTILMNELGAYNESVVDYSDLGL